MVTLPTMITIFVPSAEVNPDSLKESVLEDYYDFTGTTVMQTKEAPWVLTGIYTPYQGEQYGITSDGWIYGSRIDYYSPFQYSQPGSDRGFTVYRDSEANAYRYAENSVDYQPSEKKTVTGTDGKPVEVEINPGTGHEAGEWYTSVVFDKKHTSDIFFSKQAKYSFDGTPYNGEDSFYYEFTGWRYAFQPVADDYAFDDTGHSIKVTKTTTSLSLIWYQYYNIGSGLSGQLVLTGSDSGTAYITGDQIVRAFDSTTSTARFQMTFNGGIQMNVYIKIDQYELAHGRTVQQCYDDGYWSVMITSLSTDIDAYTGTDSRFNPMKIFTTLIDLLSFDYHNYGMSSMMGMVCTFCIVIPLYAGLISMAIYSVPMLILTGFTAIFEGILTAIRHFNIINW
jgi:hypothetical protein